MSIEFGPWNGFNVLTLESPNTRSTLSLSAAYLLFLPLPSSSYFAFRIFDFTRLLEFS